jgi:chromosome segregation ATPase
MSDVAMPASIAGEHSEFRTRLTHIEECLRKLERDVETVKNSSSINWPRIDRIEIDLKATEKDLASLQGQGQVHTTRLDAIERILNGLKDDIRAFQDNMQTIAREQRDALLEHTKVEESWQRKMLFGIVSTLLAALLTLGSSFVLKFIHP